MTTIRRSSVHVGKSAREYKEKMTYNIVTK